MGENNPDKRKAYYEQISIRLRSAFEASGYKQSDIISIATARNYSLRQSTLSKMLAGNGKSLSLTSIVEFANILELDLNDLLSTDLSINFVPPKKAKDNISSFIYRSDHKEMEPYIGSYHTCFFPTKSSDEDFLRGILEFSPASDNSKCLASFTLFTGRKDRNNKKIVKEYTGELILSPSLGIAYCILKNDEIGEISFIMFRYIRILYERLECRNALVITPCAGGHRMPTAHRMIFSSTELSDEDLYYLKGQLYLNESNILISQKGIEKLLLEHSDNLPDFEQYTNYSKENDIFMGIRPSKYYKFDESVVRSSFLDKNTKLKAINLLRTYSESPKYNKIGDNCDEILYDYITRKQDGKM